jgi:uncharacterized protein (TIGR02646 family)
MIKIDRRPKPRILEKKAEQWRDQLLAATTEPERCRLQAKYRHKEVKQTLVEMFHGKCAYCESKITHIDYGHIEHYRPKAGPRGRPDLTFEWTNLLLACGICNGGEHKSDRFPEADEDGPIVNPCEDDPVNHFTFCFDSAVKLASVYGLTPRGMLTERLLGINRPELRSHRSTRIRHLVALAKFAESDDDAAALLDSAKQSDAEYAAFARMLFPSP